MTRVEENKDVVNKMIQRAAQKPTGTYEEMVSFHLGTIATMLTDISKSLAVLADNADGAKIVLTSAEPQETFTSSEVYKMIDEECSTIIDPYKKESDS